MRLSKGLALFLSLSFAFQLHAHPTATHSNATNIGHMQLGTDLVEARSDSGTDGYYLNIDLCCSRFGLSNLEAHKLQSAFRRRLEGLAGSFLREKQQPFLQQSLEQVLKERAKIVNRGFQPLNFAPGDFVLMLDLDETLLSHWHKQDYGDFKIKSDAYFDRTLGPEPVLVHSASTIILRPGLKEFLSTVRKTPGFRGIAIYTAKADHTAQALLEAWRSYDAEFLNDLIAFFPRSYMRISSQQVRSSKDLRIIDPNLQHVVSIDDNEERLMQKELNFPIPKFHPPATRGSTESENEDLFQKISALITRCAGVDFKNCFIQAADKERHH